MGLLEQIHSQLTRRPLPVAMFSEDVRGFQNQGLASDLEGD